MAKSQLKIIVAEDHEIQRTVMCMLIEKLGYDVLPAENGAQALAHVRDSDAQILISDLNMPGLNGIELTCEVRKLDLGRYVHIIMITGRDDEGDRREALDAGVDDFMSKGPNTSMLKARIRAATRLIRHEQELADRNRILKEANDRIEEDLHAAAVAQRRLLPRFQDEMLGVRVASAFVPSSIVSGDMFGCFALSDDKLGFYAVDVSGHGVQASLLSVAIGHLITPEYFRKRVRTDDGLIDPAAMVETLNKRFYSFESDEYFTMFCGIIDKNTGQLAYCQAGYPSPFFIGADGAAQTVGDGGFPVGMLENATFENGVFDFAAGGTFVMCSDAATEATNATLDAFGAARLQSVVERAAKGASAQVPDQVIAVLSAWRGGRPLEDDLTVVALERTGSK